MDTFLKLHITHMISYFLKFLIIYLLIVCERNFASSYSPEDPIESCSVSLSKSGVLQKEDLRKELLKQVFTDILSNIGSNVGERGPMAYALTEFN